MNHQERRRLRTPRKARRCLEGRGGTSQDDLPVSIYLGRYQVGTGRLLRHQRPLRPTLLKVISTGLSNCVIYLRIAPSREICANVETKRKELACQPAPSQPSPTLGGCRTLARTGLNSRLNSSKPHHPTASIVSSLNTGCEW